METGSGMGIKGYGGMTRRRFARLATAAGLTVLTGSVLSACGSNEPSDKGTAQSSTDADTLLPATIGYWGGTCEAPIYVAHEQGYYQTCGIDDTLLQITTDVTPLLANDELDCFQLTPDKFKPIEQGLEVKVTDSVHKGCIQGATTKDSGIESVADLEGRTVAAATGSIPQIQIASQMVKLGLDPSKVNWVTYPTAEMELALDQGEVDAFASYDPYAEIAVENGKVKFFSNTDDEGLKEYLCCTLGVSQRTIDRNEEIAERLSKANKMACEYLTDNPDDAAQMMIDKGYVAGTVELNATLIKEYTWVPGDEQLLNDSVTEIWHQIARAGALEDAPTDSSGLDEYIQKLTDGMIQYEGA